MNDAHRYPGEELELFEHAVNWKRYFSQYILPFLGGRVLECGAGIGSTTVILNKGKADQWVLMEPDEVMYGVLERKCIEGVLPANCTPFRGTIKDLPSDQVFDCILYIDVLEHIERDADELLLAASILNVGGHLVVLSPAWPILFSPFDESIGHYRRYTGKMLRKLVPASLEEEGMRYIDTAGFLASLLNKLLLKQPYPSLRQVKFWDRWLIPVSKITDRIFFYSFGKTILGTWKKI